MRRCVHKLFAWLFQKFFRAVEAVEKRALRRKVSYRYLRGEGIEIGALLYPLAVSRAAKVRYIDRMPVEELKKQYPELAHGNMVAVDRVDDAERLSTFADASQDFVIANHLIEHMEDPITSLENWLRVLKPGGVLYLAFPDKRKTFDQYRPATSLEHLVQDRHGSPKSSSSRMQHYEEYARLVEMPLFKFPASEISEKAKSLEKHNYSIHFHAWTPTEFLRFLTFCNDTLPHPFDIEFMQTNNHEVIVILRKLNQRG